jgi:hypothetical protein
MAYTHSFKNDVFVSYAHDDNHFDWVTQFASFLEKELNRQIREKDRNAQPAVVWRDSALPQQGLLSEALKEEIRQSALLLIVLSDNSAKSDWCQYELQSFSQAHGAASFARLFLVEKELVSQWPKSLCKPDGERLLSRSFLQDGSAMPVPIKTHQGAPDPRAEERLRQLGKDILGALWRLRDSGAGAPLPESVFLAPYHDEPLRRQLADRLSQAGVGFRDASSAKTALKVLEEGKFEFFWQILDPYNHFDVPLDLLNEARSRNLELMLWWQPCDPGQVNRVGGDYGGLLRRMLAEGRLSCNSFDQFAAAGIARIKAQPALRGKFPCFVSVRSAPDDPALLEQFGSDLKAAAEPSQIQIHLLRPRPDMSPSQADRFLDTAHGFSFVWGNQDVVKAGLGLHMLLRDGPPPGGAYQAEALACYDPPKPMMELRPGVTLIERYRSPNPAAGDPQIAGFVRRLEAAVLRSNGPLYGSSGSAGDPPDGN